MDGNQVSSMLFPEKMSLPGFDVICVHFEAYPEVHLRSSLWTPHDVIALRLFRNVHHLCHWAEAAYGCLKPAPESRLRRTYLHLWYSMAPLKEAFFLTQDILHFSARVLVIQAARGLLTGSHPDPGHGSALVLVRRAVPGSPRLRLQTHGPGVPVVGTAVSTPWSRGRVD